MKIFIRLILIAAFVYFPINVYAENQFHKNLMEQNLTVYELKRDLRKINLRMEEINRSIPAIHQKITEQKQLMNQFRQKINEIVRAYYMGERLKWWDFLFRSKNMEQFLTASFMMARIFDYDQKTLLRFQAERKKLDDLKFSLTRELENLKLLKQRYELRIDELAKAELLLEKNIALAGDDGTAKNLLQMVVAKWEKKGLPAFQYFFETISSTMKDLPNIIKKENIQSKGFFQHTVMFSDQELNDFLEKNNDIFKHTQFTFGENELIVSGTYQDSAIFITGHYEIVSPTEIKFRIDKLLFDGYELPSTTAEDLEEKYDLGFYPSLIFPGVKIDHMEMANGTLKVDLRYQFGG